MNLHFKPKLFQDFWRFIFVWASFMLDQVLLVHATLPLHFQNKSGKYISSVQLGGMAYLDQTCTLTYGVTKPSAETHHPSTFCPSNDLRYCFQRLWWLFSMLNQSLSCELYCHSTTGFMPLAIATAAIKYRSVWVDQLGSVPSTASILHSLIVCSISPSKSSTSTSDLESTAPSTDLHNMMRCSIHSRQELQYFTPGLTPVHKITLGKPCHPSSPEFSQLLDMDNNVLWSLSKSFDKGQRF